MKIIEACLSRLCCLFVGHSWGCWSAPFVAGLFLQRKMTLRKCWMCDKIEIKELPL